MKEPRNRPLQRTVEQDLPGGAHQQVRAANNLRNFHRRVINHTSQLVRRNIVVPPDYEIAKIGPGFKRLHATTSIVKRNILPVGHPKSPTHSGQGPGRDRLRSARRVCNNRWWPLVAAGSRIQEFILAHMRCAGGLMNVFPGARARINETALPQYLKCRPIIVHPLALHVRLFRPTNIGTFPPAQAKPAHVIEHRLNKMRAAAGGIEIVHSQHQHTVVRPGAFLGCPERPCVAEVQQPGRRGCDPPPVCAKPWCECVYR